MKLSDVERKPSDILSDLSETEVYCLSDPSVLVFNRTVALSNVNRNVAGDERNSEVENGLECRHLTAVIGKQVNSGLEMSMNDTKYLISSQHLPFRINTFRDIFKHFSTTGIYGSKYSIFNLSFKTQSSSTMIFFHNLIFFNVNVQLKTCFSIYYMVLTI